MKRAGKSGTSKLKHRDNNEGSFQFVNAIPSSAAESAKTRSLVRANATKYQWQHLKRSTAPAPGSRETEEEEEELPAPNQNSAPSLSRETTSQGGEDRVHAPATKRRRSSAPQRVRLSNGDRGEVPWDGFAFPMDWDTDPVLAKWSVTDEDPKSNWMAKTCEPTSLLGAGNVDPFHVYPSSLSGESVGRLIDHIVNLIFPRLLPSASDTLKNPAVSWWLPRVMSSKALFHAFMYGAASYVHVDRGHLHKQGLAELHISYAEAIHELNKEMRDPVRACTDENTMAIAIMGNKGLRLASPRTGKLPCQAPLKGLQSLDVYGQMSLVPVHAMGLAQLVAMRGGLENIQIEGLAATISFTGVAGAVRTLTRPIFPFIPILRDSDKHSISRSASPGNEPNHKLASMGKGFSILSRLSSTCSLVPDLLIAIERMIDYTIVVDHYAQGRLMHVSLTALIDQRNGTQHALMSLPAAHSYLPDPRIEEPLYEACRLATIIYSILVIFPWPASTAPFPELVIQLKEELSRDCSHIKWQRAPELLLWILMIGGIASVGLPERMWYVEAISKVTVIMEVSSSERVRNIVQGFLWLGSTSDGDALELWGEVLQLNPLEGLNSQRTGCG